MGVKPDFMLVHFLRVVSRSFHQLLVQNRRRKRLAQALGRLAPAGPLQILDVGCGSGEVAECLGRQLSQAQFQGVDILVRPHTRIPVQAFDGRTLPYPDGSVDYTLLVDVLHHTSEPASLLRECLRVSRRGVWIKDHLCVSAWDRVRLRLMDFVGNWGHGVVLPYNYLSYRQWLEMFAELGVEPQQWSSRLQLYPKPFSWIFDDSLHFVTRLQPCEPGSED